MQKRVSCNDVFVFLTFGAKWVTIGEYLTPIGKSVHHDDFSQFVTRAGFTCFNTCFLKNLIAATRDVVSVNKFWASAIWF